MLILGIETSCDETAAAVIEAGNGQARVLYEELSSQGLVHEKYGGVVPELASREHLANLPLIVNNVLTKSNKRLQDLGCIAVTRGPGLRGCLLVGLNFARGLSAASGVPLVGVNHIEAHIFAVMLDNPELTFPFVTLIVSGGHTEIHLVRAIGNYELMARTMDDAAGEAFDKSASLLGLNYPGGAALAALGDMVQSSPYSLPKVMREAEGFSFSGLKTSAMLLIQKNEAALAADGSARAAIAFTVQAAIVDALLFKLDQAVRRSGVKSVAVTGGVSANRLLRARVQAMPGVRAYFPTPQHCTDNAAMVGYLGWLRYQRGDTLEPQAGVLDRWPVEGMNLQ